MDKSKRKRTYPDIQPASTYVKKSRLGKNENLEWHKWFLVDQDPKGFVLKFIDNYIGHGVFCEKIFEKGDLLLQYKGQLIRKEDGKNFEDETFIYHFSHKIYSCIDATLSPGLGKMVNDEIYRKANCKMKLMTTDGGVPNLCLFASKEIKAGDELRYDYGGPSRNIYWRRYLIVLYVKRL